MTVWVVEDYTFDDMCESHVSNICSSLQKAKEKVIFSLECEIECIEDELDCGEDEDEYEDEYSEAYANEQKRKLEDYRRAIEQLRNPECYSIGNYFDICNGTYTITEYTIDK